MKLNPDPTLDYIRETGITIDHHSRSCRIDTTDRRTAGTLSRRGWKEITTETSAPYRSFIGKPTDLIYRSQGRARLKGNPENLGCVRRKSPKNER